MNGRKSSRFSECVCWGVLGFAALAVLNCSAHKSGQTFGLTSESYRICKVAIFPFVNQSSYRLGDLLSYRIFMAELIEARLFEVMLEGEVRSFFRENRELPGAVVDREFYVKMGRTMGVDAVILGTILEMAEKTEGEVVIPEVRLRFELIAVESGHPVAVSYRQRSGADFRKLMHFGVVQTFSGLISRMGREVISEWKKLGIKGCVEF